MIFQSAYPEITFFDAWAMMKYLIMSGIQKRKILLVSGSERIEKIDIVRRNSTGQLNKVSSQT
jgi:hypothetical protein